MEGISVLGFELTYFWASGFQIIQHVPSSTNRSAPVLGWLSRNLELMLNMSSFTECKARKVQEVVCTRVCVSFMPPQRNTGTSGQTCYKQLVSPLRCSVQVGMLVSQGSQSISAFFNSTSTHQQLMALGLEVRKTLDLAYQ